MLIHADDRTGSCNVRFYVSTRTLCSTGYHHSHLYTPYYDCPACSKVINVSRSNMLTILLPHACLEIYCLVEMRILII